MNTNKIPYKEFEHFVLRTPLMPFQFFQSLFGENDTTDDVLINVFSSPLIQEAIFLASPALFFEIEKWRDRRLDDKSSQKVKISFGKYLSRMSSRCTPFGIFAGCSVGNISDETKIVLKKPIEHKKYTRLDMNYLVSLAQDLAKKNHIKDQLLYYANSSLYQVGNRLRYVEYFYQDGQRQHQIVEIDNSPVLQKIIKLAESGATIQTLVQEVTISGYSTHETLLFLDDVIESQVLVSSLEPSVSGPPVLQQLLESLRKLHGCENEIQFLEELSIKLDFFDNSMGSAVQKYLEFSEWLKKQPTAFSLKHLLQTDMEIATDTCSLDKKIITQVRQALIFLNRITPVPSESNLSSFKKAFYERYEESEMPLCQVLDIEMGIGYLQNTSLGDVNPLIDDLVIPEKKDPFQTQYFNVNEVYEKLLSKFYTAIGKGETVIRLNECDFDQLPEKWHDLPNTLSTIAELVQEDGNTKIRISNFGGSSAANLLARFCHEKSNLTQFVETIVEKEMESEPNKIIAEIVHLPESRVGNILMRPHLREYELPYLSNSIIPSEKQIPIQDLYISVRNNRIILRSKRHNKEVIPRLTNAHNFYVKAMPIYQFLCDMQTQDIRESIGLNNHPIFSMFKFLPRIELNNLIIQEARWKINVQDIKGLLKISNNAKLILEIRKLRSERRLPQYVKLSEGDNELLVNLENMFSVRMLLESVKRKSDFLLIEYLHGMNGHVCATDGHFSNQILVSFYKDPNNAK